MFGSTQAATSSSDYDLARTIIQQWEIYRTAVIITAVILLLVTIFLMIRKSTWAKWFLLFTIISGASIFVLDGFKVYVAKRKQTVMRETLLSPITKPIEGVGSIIKGIFGGGR